MLRGMNAHSARPARTVSVEMFRFVGITSARRFISMISGSQGRLVGAQVTSSVVKPGCYC
jgi:hypothetical protein